MSIKTFFSITPPDGQSPREWAKQYWDTYGFDYDLEKCAAAVLAWPVDDEGPEADQALKDALDEDSIEYTTFEADDDVLFGLKDAT